MIYLVSYDIADRKRLRKVSKILENFGLRVQKSFFQCELSGTALESVLRMVRKEIHIRKDSFFVYPLCDECSRRAATDGTGKLIVLEGYEIL